MEGPPGALSLINPMRIADLLHASQPPYSLSSAFSSFWGTEASTLQLIYIHRYPGFWPRPSFNSARDTGPTLLPQTLESTLVTLPVPSPGSNPVLLPQTQESTPPPPSNPSPCLWLLEPCNSASEFPAQSAQDRNTSSQSFTGSLPPDFGVWTLQPSLRTLGETKFRRFCLLKTRPPAPPS